MTKAMVRLRTRLTKAMENAEAGQGTLEYVGMIIVAAILAVAVLTIADGNSLGEKFSGMIDKVTSYGP